MSRFIREWHQQCKGFNRNVRHFFVSSLLSNIGLGIFMVIYNYYIRELGYDEQVNGRVIAMQAMATAIALLPAGFISDQKGRKKMIFIGALLTAISLLLRSIFAGESLLLMTAFMTGFFLAFIQVSAIPLLAENSSEKERVHLFSFNFALIMIANVIGNLLGGILTDAWNVLWGVSMLSSVRLTLLIGTACFFAALWPVLQIEERSKQANAHHEDTSLIQQMKQHRSSLKLIGLFAIANVLIGFGSGLVIPYLNLYFTDRFDMSTSLVGIVLSMGQAMTAIALMVGPMVAHKYGEVRAVVYLQLASLPFLLVAAFTMNPWLAVLAFLFRQALMNAGNPIQMALMMRSVHPAMKGLANSVGQMVFQLGWAVMGPVSAGIVVVYGPYTGYAIAFSMTAILYLIGSAYFFLVFQRVN
ncbi:MFS transporter [Halalkalibacterium halodurans]|uniref:Multidrug transporter n=1 Tax=Halalkalibacterium halodurans TaxID=86665 RepID=A0A0M0KGV5_ALKHA|nr:MFS transporter [Halalkalibacterium halodurans]TES52410.1 MFS transporter [Halalkalibacterium halodurans]TPE66726.1 MFS transporter [Halalkalibacterium halodurans]